MNKMPEVGSELIHICRNNMDLKTIVCFLGVDLVAHTADCPFCEAPRQFHVDNTRGIYKCFRCEAGGDLFAFIMHKRKYSFTKAVTWLSALLSFKDPSLCGQLKAALTAEGKRVGS